MASPTQAATITVTDAAGLRDAIDTANLDAAPDTIELGGVSADYVLAIDLPVITTPIHFVGPGSSALELDANGHLAFGLHRDGRRGIADRADGV